MSLVKKISILAILIFLNSTLAIGQEDSLQQKELGAFAGNISKTLWIPKEELTKIKSEMFFVLFHIRDFKISSFEIFANSDTLIKKSVNNFFENNSNKVIFKYTQNHDFVVSLVIKNLHQPKTKEVNTDYNYLLWKNGKIKRPNDIKSIFSYPTFVYLSSGQNEK